MLRLGHILLLSLALLIAWPGDLHAGSLAKVWELDLRKAFQADFSGPNPSFKVRSLSFSPDAQQVVIVLQGRALLIRAQDPRSILGKFQIDGHESFGWSPDSQIIYSGRHVVRLANSESCDLPRKTLFPHFIGNDLLVAMPPPAPLIAPAQGLFAFPGYRTLGFYDASCHERDRWNVEEVGVSKTLRLIGSCFRSQS